MVHNILKRFSFSGFAICFTMSSLTFLISACKWKPLALLSGQKSISPMGLDVLDVLDVADVSILFPPAASNGLKVTLQDVLVGHEFNPNLEVPAVVPSDGGFGKVLFPGEDTPTTEDAVTVHLQVPLLCWHNLCLQA